MKPRKAWWEASLSGDKPVGLAWIAMLGFVRLMSNPRVLAHPMAAPEAAGLCTSWLEEPNVDVVLPGPNHLDILANLLEGRTSPNLVTDAHLAALAIEHQAELHSNDSGFSRFSGLTWRDPVADSPA